MSKHKIWVERLIRKQIHVKRVCPRYVNILHYYLYTVYIGDAIKLLVFLHILCFSGTNRKNPQRKILSPVVMFLNCNFVDMHEIF